MRLLFTCAHWHGLAKLRMHTDLTLNVMDCVTTEIGAGLRDFQTKLCPAFTTRELQREADARRRRQSKNAKAGADETKKASVNDGKKKKKKAFNIQTYKCHALGDYVETIRKFGTTDSYSTEPVSTLPRLPLLALMSKDRESLNIAARKQDIVGQTVNLSSGN
jgi:hypothetical protein